MLGELRLNGLDLFSGIGGAQLALEPWIKPVAYCENDESAQNILLELQSRGEITIAPIWDDIRTLTAEHLPQIDIITAGFPCQDLSFANCNAKGLAGKRSGLFFEIARLIRECRPEFVFLENVPGLITRGLGTVLMELHALGFDARWTIVSAEEVGASQVRERLWIMAYFKSERSREEREFRCIKSTEWVTCCGEKKDVPDNKSIRSREGSTAFGNESSQSLLVGHDKIRGGYPDFWLSEPDVGRMVDGLPVAVDRLKGLGNAWVPLSGRKAFKKLLSGSEG